MTGQVVYGDKYFSRIKDENKIWRQLKKGSHLLVLAPRRVGKTSLLRNLEKNPKDGYLFLYNIVQSCSSEHEYYSAIIENLFSSDFTDNLKTITHWGAEQLTKFKHSIKDLKVCEAGVSFNNEKRSLTHKDLKKVLEKINIDKKLIVVIDEFPDVLEKISNEQGKSQAEAFLSGCRELWQDPKLDQKVQFIFTGSIGLDTLVHKLNLSDLINALIPARVNPLEENKALEFIDFITKDSDEGIILTDEIKQYLLDKIGWLMPYYIELLWNSLEDLCAENEITNPTTKDLDQAYSDLFNQENRSYFIHWVERLNRFEATEKEFAKAILKQISEANSISIEELHNIKVLFASNEINCDYICTCLEHDGYIFFNDQEKIYQFTSPLLKDWWRNYALKSI